MLSASLINLRTGVLLGVSLFLFSCENDEKEVAALTEKRVLMDEAIDMQSIFSQGGKTKAKLTSPLMRYFETDSAYYEFPKTLHVNFYNDSTLQIESQLDARYGRYRKNEERVFLKDSVVVFNVRGDTLRSRELWWDQQKKIFYTDKPARIRRKDGTVIYGQNGLTATQDLSETSFYEVSGAVPRPKDEMFLP